MRRENMSVQKFSHRDRKQLNVCCPVLLSNYVSVRIKLMWTICDHVKKNIYWRLAHEKLNHMWKTNVQIIKSLWNHVKTNESWIQLNRVKNIYNWVAIESCENELIKGSAVKIKNLWKVGEGYEVHVNSWTFFFLWSQRVGGWGQDVRGWK